MTMTMRMPMAMMVMVIRTMMMAMAITLTRTMTMMIQIHIHKHIIDLIRINMLNIQGLSENPNTKARDMNVFVCIDLLCSFRHPAIAMSATDPLQDRSGRGAYAS